MPHEPIALAVGQCRREKVSSTRNEIAAVENHEDVCTTEGTVLSNIKDPDFVSLHPGYTTGTTGT